MAAQSNEHPQEIALKTNPLQYPNKEFNLSLEFVKGQDAFEATVATQFPIPSYYSSFFRNFAAFGTGAKGHLMYRRYTRSGVLFIGIGLAYKFWQYNRRLISFEEGLDGCSLQSRTAHLPGVKALWGLKARLFERRALVEPYMGVGLRYKMVTVNEHAYSNGWSGGCQPLINQEEQRVLSPNLAPAIYFGVNVGVNFWPKAAE
ncbi:MAG: hypothetical protein AAF570_12190 [Bacteroidota bacterium]